MYSTNVVNALQIQSVPKIYVMVPCHILICKSNTTAYGTAIVLAIGMELGETGAANFFKHLSTFRPGIALR